jgi:predicted anti-sigma-YlaC factor YlaD
MIRIHLWMCRHCRRVYRQLHRLRGITRYDEADVSDCPPDLPATLSPEACERIKKKLQACK